MYTEEELFQRAAELTPYFEEAAHSLRGLPHVKDIRNLGLVAGIELESIPGKPGARAYELFTKAFWDKDLLTRVTGDIVALSPPLIINKAQIDVMFGSIADILKAMK